MSQASEIVITPHEEIVLAALEFPRMRDEQADAVQAEVAAAAEKTPDLPVVLDMSKVEYVPSRGIGALVALLQKFKQDSRRFILADLQPHVRETLTVCRLDKLFELCDSVDEALARIREPS